MNSKTLVVGVVGPCASGKTTLIHGLSALGYNAKHIAQEHSYVSDMWQRISKPDILIYLDVSYPLTIVRRKMDWSIDEYYEQIRRLNHARQHADFYVQTDQLSIDDVFSSVFDFIVAFSKNMVGHSTNSGV